jgi:hypothetical protein
MIITTNTFAKDLWPGVNSWYGQEYNEHPTYYKDLFTTEKSSRAYEEDVGVSGFGLARVKAEGAPIEYDTAMQGFTTRYRHVTYALGFIVTREAAEDGIAGVAAKKNARSLAQSMRKTKETIAANVYNRATNSAYKGGDDKELLSTSHPNVAGGTQSNLLGGVMSESTIQDAIKMAMRFKDDRGLLTNTQLTSLIVSPDMMFEADRILNSQYKVGGELNDINTVYMNSRLPKGVKVNPYLTDTDAYYFRTDVKDGLKHFERRADSFDMDNDFDTENAKYKASGRYSFGWTDYRGLIGYM